MTTTIQTTIDSRRFASCGGQSQVSIIRRQPVQTVAATMHCMVDTRGCDQFHRFKNPQGYYNTHNAAAYLS